MANIPQSFGKYRILAEIARGSFGRVYRGEDTSRHNYPVAIKVMHAAHLASPQERSTFLQEAQLLTMLRHPHIVPVLDVGIEEELPYLVMEYAANGSLHQRLQSLAPRPLSLQDALTMIGQVGAALHYAHQQNVIHRDLKPANILFNARGDALLADFGIATMLANSMKSGTVVGTPYYMAPEQFRGTISKEGDQYALGCIAYQAMTGRLPFDAPDFFALGYKHLSETPIAPTQLNLLIPYPVEAAIMRAIAKDRTRRFPDIEAFLIALGAPLPALAPVPPPYQAVPETPVPPAADHTPTVIQSSSADARVFTPRRFIEEEGKTPLPPIPLRQSVREEEGKSPLPAVPLTPAAREEERQMLVSSNPLQRAPAAEDVPAAVLPREVAGPVTPNPDLPSWPDLSGSGVQDNIPTFKKSSAVTEEREPTLPARPLTDHDDRGIIGSPPRQAVVEREEREPTILARPFANHDDQGKMVFGMPPGGRPLVPDAATEPEPPGKARRTKKRRRVGPALIASLIALVVLLIGSGVLYAMTGPALPQTLSKALQQAHILPATAQVSITAARTVVNKTYVIAAVGAPDPAQNQVQERALYSTTSTRYTSVSATGKGTIAAKAASGSMYIKNLLSNTAIGYGSGLCFSAGNGYKACLSQSGSIAASASVVVPAYATPSGAGGNIAAGTISTDVSCGSSYPQCAYVTNYAFSGGADFSSYSYVQQSDINNAVSRATALYQGSEIAAGQSSVAGQMRSGERMFGGTGCSSHYTHSPAAGTRNVSTVTAGIWVTCSAEVYDYNGALSMAASLLKQSITSVPNETLLGSVTTSMLSVYASNGAIIMKVAAQGTEVYTFSPSLLRLFASLIAGRTVQDAVAVLERQPGVSKAVITVSGGSGTTLPTDTGKITMTVVSS